MNRTILWLLCFMFCLALDAKDNALLDSLDRVIGKSNEYVKTKTRRIQLLKQMANKEKDDKQKLKLYSDITEEYHYFQFDSALVYVDKGLRSAQNANVQYYVDQNTITRADLLAIGGLYSEAVACIDTIDSSRLDKEMLLKYNMTFSRVYRYWSDYCGDNDYRPLYRDRASGYLKAAVALMDKNNPVYDYYMGEYHIYIERDDEKALAHYFNAVEKLPMDSREYAMASYAIANNYSSHDEMDKYEEYLIRACISDILCCTKENLALQNLALYLFNKDKDNIERAEHYIQVSLSDARFYNNRLRILEISQKLPSIVGSYQEMIKERNDTYRVTLWVISLLLLGLVVSLFFIIKQNKLLTSRRHELANKNEELSQANNKLSFVNSLLVDTNHKREGLAKIYIELCAKYIDRLSKFQTLVKRKIKANQAAELLTNISSSRLSEEDAAVFLNKFDKAFLDLYPTFIEEFNSLLQEGQQVVIKQEGQMTPELRIFALVRLGIHDSSDIASLLFYSLQTIYNYRSAIKNRAVNRDTFEEDVTKLCKVIGK